MKRSILFTLAIALCLVGCNKSVELAPMEEVSFSLGLPGDLSPVTKAATTYVNSAKGGVTNLANTQLKWTVNIYLGTTTTGNPVFHDVVTPTGTNAVTTYNKTVKLVSGATYTLVAKAEYENPGSFNDEKEDCYELTKEITVGTTPADDLRNLKLTRPTGKLRLIALDYAEYVQAEPLKQISAVKVEYTVPTGTGTFTSNLNNYTADGTSFENGKTIFVDYLEGGTTSSDSKNYQIKLTLTLGSGASPETKEISITPDIPIKKNALTTIKGRIFSEEVQFTISIDEDFEGTEEVIDLDASTTTP